MQEKELGNSLERFSQTFKNWDSNKCPVARYAYFSNHLVCYYVFLFRRLLGNTKSAKVVRLRGNLQNDSDYQYDYDLLSVGYDTTGHLFIIDERLICFF